MRSKVFSDGLSSYIKATLKVLEIFKMDGYFLYSPGGFSGLVVSVLASGTQDRGFAPDRSRRIFPAGKIHSMPSLGGEIK
jgi:hypothetical protein